MKFVTRQQEFILLTIHRLKDRASLVAIQKYLNQITGKKWSLSSIYLPLNKMEREGFLNTAIGAPTARRGGKAIKYYSLSEEGYGALANIKALQNRFWAENPDLAEEK